MRPPSSRALRLSSLFSGSRRKRFTIDPHMKTWGGAVAASAEDDLALLSTLVAEEIDKLLINVENPAPDDDKTEIK